MMHRSRQTEPLYLLDSKQNEKSKDQTLNVNSKVDSEETLCRVCLTEGGISIYGSECSDDLSKYLSTFTGIHLEVDDVFPKHLCEPCYSLLNGAIFLRKTAQQTEEILKKHSRKKLKKKDLPTISKITTPGSSEIRSITEDDYDSNFMDHDYNSSLDIVEEGGKEKEEYYCQRCKVGFERYEEYAEHRMSDEHENVKIKCEFCNKLYAPLYYKKHIAIHTGDVPYMCDVCGKKFSVKGQCTRHRLTHFYSLPFQCSLCPYKGRFRESLKMHMRTHTGEKPYQCTQCAARFINKSNLNKHMFTHKGNHNFRCEVCGRGFYTEKDLDLHFKVDHRGIKEHVCNICDKAFGYRKQMMKHQLKVHKREKLRSGRVPLYLQVASQKEEEQIAS